MERYLLSVIQPAGPPPPPDDLAAIMRDVNALQDEMNAAGVWVFAGGLQPPDTATVVRVSDGETLTTDGPYIESKGGVRSVLWFTRHLRSTHRRNIEELVSRGPSYSLLPWMQTWRRELVPRRR